jgi:biotin carboxylase
MVCGLGKGMDRSLAKIKELGIDIVVATDVVTEEVRRTASQVVLIDACHSEQVETAVQAAGIAQIDGVLSLGIDNPPVIARLCRMFGCRGLDPEVARNCTEKDRRIAILQRAGLRTPCYGVCDTLAEAMATIEAIGLPVVVKPNDRTESIGVAKIDTPSAAARLIQQALRASRSRRVLIEEFLSGTEHTVVGIATDGDVIITGISDRDYAQKELFPPFFFERGDLVPTSLAPERVARMRETILRGLQALDLAPAVFTADVLIAEPDGDVVLIELAGRMPGARIATEVIPLATGVDILPSAVRIAFGLPIDRRELEPSRHKAVVQRYLPARGQTVEWVGDIAAVARALGVYDLYWGVPVVRGLRLHPYRSGYDILAGVIASGETLTETEKTADLALAMLPLRFRGRGRQAIPYSPRGDWA